MQRAERLDHVASLLQSIGSKVHSPLTAGQSLENAIVIIPNSCSTIWDSKAIVVFTSRTQEAVGEVLSTEWAQIEDR